ncbi:hypothetical protein OIU76_021835 [Salix suchowensis]|uniref:Uncharacterized protein n=1 Tax=Salix suchowensis TaxID=1278906 RepID=A0ABQ9AK40_9ROSI|nr:hypothetical protein OIU76_021835 [Salix suchowensis]KAJ6340143.1 hypothetical protein OIU77_007985 [Salix suchowensis]KAJ6340144.1 hypothetical protein OIU77_007985 [Salix suchowensis]
MFPLSSNGYDPISYNDHQAYNMPFFSDIISNSKQYVPPPISFCHLPSPAFFAYDQPELEDHSILLQQSYDLLLHQQPLRATATSTAPSQSTVGNINMVDSSKNDVIDEITEICNKQSHSSTEQVPRKRSSKKDRHSKINTAQGPRDRRMRLSLKVARDFFDLQDKLRFDKASKTVEWLLTQARTEIKKISGGFPVMNYSCSTTVGAKSASSTSECEVLSEMINIDSTLKVSRVSKGKSSLCVKKERRTSRASSSRKAPLNPFAKEAREKARERARERTKQKLRSRSRRLDESKPCELEAVNQELNQFAGCWSPFETGDQESGTHNINPSLEVQLVEAEVPFYQEKEQLDAREGMIDETLVSIGKWSPSFPNHLHKDGIPQENQFTDFQYPLYKTWDHEAYNIDGMC